MSAELKFSADGADQLADALRQYIKAGPKSVPEGTRTQFDLLLRKNVIPLTPPNTKYQGEAAVDRDVRRAIKVLRPEDYSSKGIRTLIRKRDYSTLQTVFGRMRGLTNLGNAKFGPFDPQQHMSQRDRRGRVRERKNYQFATADADAVKAYVKERKGWVGQAKGGWSKPLIVMGRGPGAWIAKHSRFGDFEDKLDSVGGYIKAVNRSAWAKGGQDARVVNAAVKSRAAAITKDLQRREERAAAEKGLAK